MPVPIWAGHYIGLPFMDHGRDRQGLDCWGLVRLVQAERFARSLPSFSRDYDRTTNVARISALIERECTHWKRVALNSAALGDVIVMRVRGAPMHVGLVLGDSQMLHIEFGIDSVIEKYDGARWKDRIHGFYRYQPFDHRIPPDDDPFEDIFTLS